MQKYTKRLLKYFFQGLLYLAPITITVYALVITFNLLDGVPRRFIEKNVGLELPGLGLLLILLFITFVGFLGSSIILKPLMAYIDKTISRAPLISIIYTSIKDMLSAVVGNKRKFNIPVIVKVNKEADLEKLGFITQSDLTHLGIPANKIAVYLPHSYNFSGNLFIVPSENVRKLNAPPAEVMKFIVSAGVTNL
ncbi:MAG: DUF502 domain-containing protein [Lentimicrobiaceae bacterium]|nr:DUF502 domain-containing protein [Lentimicrobiaceae bacterium]